MIVLETERLILRRMIESDLDALFALYRDIEIRRYFPDGVRTLEETKEELEWFLQGHPEHSGLGLWATVDRETGEFIGRCGLLPWMIDGVLEIEIAYMIDKRFWRRGLAGEAARALVRYGFEELRLPRLIALIDADHTASIRTAQKAGLTFDKMIEMDGISSAVYAIARPAQ